MLAYQITSNFMSGFGPGNASAPTSAATAICAKTSHDLIPYVTSVHMFARAMITQSVAALHTLPPSIYKSVVGLNQPHI